ncbi:AAA family ATPase [Labrenzia sp. CE80]|uniref:AAA family ATPase n=1 Tax=Labrenzia sp. CE80 TaxID=1788986 RepID=UPI00129B54C2|nr:AAA family ATPase [Labrenzia sp. CE80]
MSRLNLPHQKDGPVFDLVYCLVATAKVPLHNPDGSVTERKFELTHIVIINGPGGVGKTTISASLARMLPGTINISGDVIRWFAPPDVSQYLGHGSTYRAGASLATAYLGMGAPRVIFDYVFDDVEKISRFCQWLPADTRVHLFTIWAPIETVIEREATRDGREPLGDRTLDTYRAVERNLRSLGCTVQNTTSPDAAAAAICVKIAETEGKPAARLVRS